MKRKTLMQNNNTAIVIFKSCIKLIMALLLLHAGEFSAQTSAPIDSLLHKYKFIRGDLSHLQNDSAALASFYKKLKALKNGNNAKVSIVHIGDSHIQADFFSGTVRKKLGMEFGSAGRGLIFPYRIAKTNGPPDYKTSSNKEWKAKRNVFPDQPMPIGISGITIETEDTSAYINIAIKDTSGIDYSIKKITLFHSKNPENFGWAIVTDSTMPPKCIFPSAKSNSPFTSEYFFDAPIKNFTLKCIAKDSTQTCDFIFGLLLENGKPGIIYNMIGVNGAMYEHYIRSEYFVQQMSLLQPDMIIISLGTNESYYKNFDSTAFYYSIDTLVTSIRKNNPAAAFLLTTPGDCLKKVRKGKKRFYAKNPSVLSARNTIITYCRKNDLAYWDWLEVMGGYGVMNEWYKNKMSDKLRLHLSTLGYLIQGELLYKAMMESFNKYEGSKK